MTPPKEEQLVAGLMIELLLLLLNYKNMQKPFSVPCFEYMFAY